MREQIDPIPHIQELNQAVREVLDLAEIRNDKELEAKIKQLVIALTQSRIRVLNAITGPMGLIHLLLNEHKEGRANDFLDKTKNSFETGLARLNSIRPEYDELNILANKQIGRDILKGLTTEEHDELRRGIFKPKS